MEDPSLLASLPDDVNELKRLLMARDHVITEHRATITRLTQERDEYYLEKLRLEMRLAKALKQAYGPRADRVRDLGQLLLSFGEHLDASAIRFEDLPDDSDDADEARTDKPASKRRLRTRGRRDIGKLDHLPMIEQRYELADELCRCPHCQADREKIGSAVSYTVEYIPATLVRIKHIQHKYACRHCEQNGHNPNITLAAKTNGSPIDKGLLAYVATSKFSDYLPLHRLQTIFAREGFALDRSTMCVWMADVARLVRPLYDRMVQRVLQSHVLATDDTVMPMQQPGKTKKARMWIYQGDESHPYNVFDFTVSHTRDGPARFLKDCSSDGKAVGIDFGSDVQLTYTETITNLINGSSTANSKWLVIDQVFTDGQLESDWTLKSGDGYFFFAEQGWEGDLTWQAAKPSPPYDPETMRR